MHFFLLFQKFRGPGFPPAPLYDPLHTQYWKSTWVGGQTCALLSELRAKQKEEEETRAAIAAVAAAEAKAAAAAANGSRRGRGGRAK